MTPIMSNILSLFDDVKVLRLTNASMLGSDAKYVGTRAVSSATADLEELKSFHFSCLSVIMPGTNSLPNVISHPALSNLSSLDIDLSDVAALGRFLRTIESTLTSLRLLMGGAAPNTPGEPSSADMFS